MKIISLFFLYFLSSCAHYEAFIDLDAIAKKYDVKMIKRIKAHDRGVPLVASQRGPIHKSCSTLAREAVEKLIAYAKVEKLHFIYIDSWKFSETKVAVCEKRWGWFMIPFMPFTPAFSSVEVRALAVAKD